MRCVPVTPKNGLKYWYALRSQPQFGPFPGLAWRAASVANTARSRAWRVPKDTSTAAAVGTTNGGWDCP